MAHLPEEADRPVGVLSVPGGGPEPEPAGAEPGPPPRSRGVIALVAENCTVCMLCARECPDWCIYIDSHKETLPAPGGGRPRTRNVLDRFAIDFSLCMYCGICVEVCPFDALFWSPEAEYAEYDVRDLVHEQDRLAGWAETVPLPPALETDVRRRDAPTGRPGPEPGRRPEDTAGPAVPGAAGRPEGRRPRFTRDDVRAIRPPGALPRTGTAERAQPAGPRPPAAEPSRSEGRRPRFTWESVRAIRPPGALPRGPEPPRPAAEPGGPEPDDSRRGASGSGDPEPGAE